MYLHSPKEALRGQEVRNIQTRLISWGYMSGSADGIYGAKTEAGVKKFQSKHGLTPDGIAGPATLAKIGLPSGTSSSSNDANINLIARVVNGEARGESYEVTSSHCRSYFKQSKTFILPEQYCGRYLSAGSFYRCFGRSDKCCNVFFVL